MNAHQIIAQRVESRKILLEKWFKEKTKELSFPIYSSFDIRDAGFKCASVDANFFPAGFNNLNTGEIQNSSHLFKLYINSHYPGTNHIHIYPENHTRNSPYLKHIQTLKNILSRTGYQVTSGSSQLNSFLSTYCLEINFSYDRVIYEALEINIKDIGKPDLILLNSDLSCGLPGELLTQSTTPPINVGWYQRKKSDHFRFLNELGYEVADLLGIDPWLFLTSFSEVDGINLVDDKSWGQLCVAVDDLMHRIRASYNFHRIESDPRVFVKNNSGTYGLGVLCVQSGDELKQLSSRTRRKSFYSRTGELPNSFLIQEAVPTHYHFRGIPYESVIYLIGSQFAGHFFRINKNGNYFGNLNTPSASYFNEKDGVFISEDQRKTYSFIAKLSSLGMGQEMHKSIP